MKIISPFKLRLTGILLVALSGGFWLWFGIASGIGEKLGLLGFVMHLTPALWVLIFGTLAWFLPRRGAVLLIAAGTLIAAAYLYVTYGGPLPATTRIFVIATLAGPLVLAGFAFLAAGRIISLPSTMQSQR